MSLDLLESWISLNLRWGLIASEWLSFPLSSQRERHQNSLELISSLIIRMEIKSEVKVLYDAQKKVSACGTGSRDNLGEILEKRERIPLRQTSETFSGFTDFVEFHLIIHSSFFPSSFSQWYISFASVKVPFPSPTRISHFHINLCWFSLLFLLLFPLPLNDIKTFSSVSFFHINISVEKENWENWENLENLIFGSSVFVVVVSLRNFIELAEASRTQLLNVRANDREELTLNLI